MFLLGTFLLAGLLYCMRDDATCTQVLCVFALVVVCVRTFYACWTLYATRWSMDAGAAYHEIVFVCALVLYVIWLMS